ncbi:Rossmann-like and DUF2520 domain-containing protein [Leucobacter soli]|uniref:DUF2520 domain-containing protein n=2 Tax=Leucobacter soli TaxID=2812850 RepID=A0A916JXM3_9MICO|nr:hypothetical protein LEUCIP111803_01631 [Leucobacter soli]
MQRIEVVGAGRMGTALVRALRGAGRDVPDPSPRGATGAGADIVLLAVPDAAIAGAARCIVPGHLVGHLSGATTLDPLEPHERFSLHPLITILAPDPDPDPGSGAGVAGASPFIGASAAVAGSTDRALAVAEGLATELGMRTLRVAEQDRALYHAAASVASNFLVALEWFAERLAASAGVDRAALAPLVAAAERNWAEVGPELALTGPIARGDTATVARQRAAIAEHLPERVALFDELVHLTEDLARTGRGPVPSESGTSESGTEDR